MGSARSLKGSFFFFFLLCLNSQVLSAPCVEFSLVNSKDNTSGKSSVGKSSRGQVARLSKDLQRWSLQNLPPNFEGEYKVYRRLALDFFTGEVSFGEESKVSIKGIPSEFQIAVVEMISGRPRRVRWLTDESEFVQPGGSSRGKSTLQIEMSLDENSKLVRMTLSPSAVFLNPTNSVDMEALFVRSEMRSYWLGGKDLESFRFSWTPEMAMNGTQNFIGVFEFNYEGVGKASVLKEIVAHSTGLMGAKVSKIEIHKSPDVPRLNVSIGDTLSTAQGISEVLLLGALLSDGKRRGVGWTLELFSDLNSEDPKKRGEAEKYFRETTSNTKQMADNVFDKVAFGKSFDFPENFGGAQGNSYVMNEAASNRDESSPGIKLGRLTQTQFARVALGEEEKRVEVSQVSAPIVNQENLLDPAEIQSKEAQIHYQIRSFSEGVLRPVLTHLQSQASTHRPSEGESLAAKRKELESASRAFRFQGHRWLEESSDWLSLDVGWLFDPSRFVNEILLSNLMNGGPAGHIELLRPWKSYQRNEILKSSAPRSFEKIVVWAKRELITDLIEAKGKPVSSLEAQIPETRTFLESLAPRGTSFEIIQKNLSSQFRRVSNLAFLPKDRMLPVLPIDLQAQGVEIFSLLKLPGLQSNSQNRLVNFLSATGDVSEALRKLRSQITNPEYLKMVEKLSVRDFVQMQLDLEGFVELIADPRAHIASWQASYDYLRHFNKVANLFGFPISELPQRGMQITQFDLTHRLRVQEELLRLFPELSALKRFPKARVLWSANHMQNSVDNSEEGAMKHALMTIGMLKAQTEPGGDLPAVLFDQNVFYQGLSVGD